jgi:hypothetical protein
VYADTISCNLPTNNFAKIPLHFYCIDAGSGSPIPNCKFIYELSENVGEGGHAHSGRPLGELSTSSAIIPPQGYSNIYTASDVGGIITLSIYIEIGASRFGPFNYGILVASDGGMVSLAFPGFLNFDVTSHPGDGMYMDDQRASSKLIDILAAYYAEFRNIGITATTVTSGGASLSRGGLFDISKDWNPSHCGHRFGNEIDLSHRRLNRDERNALSVAISESDFRFKYVSESPENSKATHWHIAF